jgi:hypothetical protein
MPEFLVDADAVADASLRLATVEGGVTDVLGRLGHHAGAASGTPAAGAVDDLLGHFSRVLPEFALAGAQLSRAVLAAASDYRRIDGAIGQACEPRHDQRGGGPT